MYVSSVEDEMNIRIVNRKTLSKNALNYGENCCVPKICQKIAKKTTKNLPKNCQKSAKKTTKNLPLFCHFKYAKIVSWDE